MNSYLVDQNKLFYRRLAILPKPGDVVFVQWDQDKTMSYWEAVVTGLEMNGFYQVVYTGTFNGIKALVAGSRLYVKLMFHSPQN